MRLLTAGGAAFLVAYFGLQLESRWIGPSPRPLHHGIASAIIATLAYGAFGVVADPGHLEWPRFGTESVLFTGLLSAFFAHRRRARELEGAEASPADPRVVRAIDP